MLKVLLRAMSVNVLTLIIRIISGFVFPRFMTTQDYADYQTFSLYLGYLPMLTLGFSTGMFLRYGGHSFKDIDKARYKSEYRLLLGILVCFFALGILIWIIYPDRMLLCISLCVIPYCLVNSYQSLYQSWGEFGRYNRSQMIVAAVPVLGSLAVFILKGNLNVNVFICLFLCTYWLLAIRILAGNAKVTVGVTANSVLDQTNLHTWKTGIAICIGSYIQVIIHSLDKQIVKLMFDTTEFARYCFALSLQSIPTLLITTLSQPLYHFLAKGQIRENQYPVLMRGLLMLGACCGIGYFACAWIVSAVLPDYILSLDIAAVYFLAIPPMAVLQGLYINLYKLKRQMKRYVIRSAEILFLLVLLNSLLLMSVKNMTSVAVTYVIVSYLWFWADSKFFPSTLVSLKDGLFLTGTVTAFLLSQTSSHLMSGALIYVIALVVLCATIYRREAWTAIHYLLRNRI